MNLLLSSAYVGGLQVTGGGNGMHVTRFAWRKVPRPQRHPRAAAHGTVDHTRYYDARLFELAGHIRGVTDDEAQALLDSLEQELALDGDSLLFRWQLAGQAEGEQAEVRIEGTLDYAFDVESSTVLRWALTLFAGDPLRYGQTLRTGAYDPTVGASAAGIGFPLVFPLDFAGESTTWLEVTNAGTYPTPPTFTITGPTTNPIIDNDTTGESIYTEGLQLATGEQVVIDVAARTLSIGEVERPDLIDARLTTWLSLVPGANRLRLRGNDHVAGQTELAVAFRDARV